LQQQDTLGQEQISVLLCRQATAATGLAKSGLLVGSSRAIGSTGSARKRLRARQLRCLGDKFALECCRQR
jgi:hypothetical protein